MVAAEAHQMHACRQDRRCLGRDVARDLGMAAVVEAAVAIVDHGECGERVTAERVLRVAVEDGRGPPDRLRPEAGARAVGDGGVERDAPDRDVDPSEIAAVAAAHEGQRAAIGRLLASRPGAGPERHCRSGEVAVECCSWPHCSVLCTAEMELCVAKRQKGAVKWEPGGSPGCCATAVGPAEGQSLG